MATRPKRPRDFNQLAKLIVDIAVGETKEKPPKKSKKKASKTTPVRRKAG
jgi:hypothetical protein